MAIRTITWTVDEKLQISPKARQHAGVQGDNNATEAVFELPPLLQSGYVLYLEFIGTYGAYDKTEELEVQGGAVRFPLPKAWTQEGGDATIRLAAVQEREGAEVSGYTFAGRVCFEDRPAFGRVKSLLAGTIHKLLELAQGSAEVAQEQAAAAADDAARAEAASVSAKMDSQAAAASAGEAKSAVDEVKVNAQAAAVNAADSKKDAQMASASANEAQAASDAAKRESQTATASANEARGYSSHPPVIGADGNWMQWDGDQYVSTGHPSQGEQGIQGEKGEKGEQGIQGEQGVPGEVTADYANSTYANAIKGTVSGTGIVQLNKVSPIEHEIDVLLTTAEPIKLTGSTLSIFGKNLVSKEMLIANGWKLQEDGTLYATGSDVLNKLLYKHNGTPGKITISYDCRATASNSSAPLPYITYTDGSYQRLWPPATTDPYHYTITSYGDKIIDKVTWTYGSDKTVGGWIQNVQVELGSVETEYEPCQLTEYIVDDENKVSGVRSVYPTTTLIMADANVTIMATYNKDTVAVVNDLTERIAALEDAIVNN